MEWSAAMLDSASVAAHSDYPLNGILLVPV